MQEYVSHHSKIPHNTSHPPNNNEREMIDITTSPETPKEKPVVPQPTSSSTYPIFHAALRTEGREIVEGLIESLPLLDMEKRSDDLITTPEGRGSPKLYPSLHAAAASFPKALAELKLLGETTASYESQVWWIDRYSIEIEKHAH